MKLLRFSVLLFCINLWTAQSISSKKWTDLFSYNNVLALCEDNGRIIAATENGLFFYTPATGEITKLSKANGLHEVKITAFDYNPETKLGLVGYKTGALDIISPEGVTLSVDIPIAASYSGDKKINHISITGNNAVVSTGYGVSIFKLKEKEFGDTAFFVNNGVYENVNEATILNNRVFAVTNTGLKSHDMSVTFPIFSTWTVNQSGTFTQIDANSIVAFANTNNVQFGDGTSFSTISQSFTSVKDVSVTAQNIVVTDKNRIYVYNLSGSLVKNFNVNEDLNTGMYYNSEILAGTMVSGIKNETMQSIKPDGPYSNYSYKISLLNGQIWVSSGGRASFNTPIYRDLGYYHFDGSKWIYPSYFINNPLTFNILDVTPNPSKPSEVFFTNYSFFSGEKGIYKMENNQFVKSYDVLSNQFLNRSVGLTFDQNNNLFCSVMLLDNPNFSLGYFYYDRPTDKFTSIPIIKAGGAQKPIAKDGILYIPCPFYGDGGMLMYQYGNSPAATGAPTKILRTNNNLPANGTISAAIDNDDVLWIGTRVGLRIIPDVQSIISNPQANTEPIIIEVNGVGEEAFRNNNILQIAVDTGNQKWISVEDGGVFYLTANGENTIDHFTKSNSPLPTDNVTDVQIDNKTGKVYFVTLDGIVVYQGDAVNVNSGFGDVLVYPNPVVYSNYKGNVRIRGLAQKTNIKITDTAGNLVHQAITTGGFHEWDLNNLRGNRVASGMYFVLMTNEDGTDKATAKIAVVN